MSLFLHFPAGAALHSGCGQEQNRPMDLYEGESHSRDAQAHVGMGGGDGLSQEEPACTYLRTDMPAGLQLQPSGCGRANHFLLAFHTRLCPPLLTVVYEWTGPWGFSSAHTFCSQSPQVKQSRCTFSLPGTAPQPLPAAD